MTKKNPLYLLYLLKYMTHIWVWSGTTPWAIPWLRQFITGLSKWRPRFVPRPVHVEFVVYKVALGHVYLKGLNFSPVSIILPALHAHSFINDAIQFQQVVK